MKPPKRIYAKAYRNQQGDVVVEAAAHLFDVVEDDGQETTVGTYVLDKIESCRKVVESVD